MTAGLPGAGIGGLFYLLMALFMPVCELAGAWRGRTPGRSLARGQAVLAGTILLAIWLTGWLLGLLVVAHSWSPAGPGAGAVAGAHLQVIGRSMVYLSLGTLGVVLAGVELLRLVVVRATPPKTVPLASEPENPAMRPPENTLMPSRRRRSRHYAAVIALGGGLALVLCGAPSRARADSGPDTRTEASLALAEAAFARGDCDTAGREYAAVLAIDPEHPRALFRLAQIRRTDTAAAVSLLRTYVRVEPSDPWGYLALANALADAGSRHADEALRIYEEAAARAPTDRDIALGRPRLLVRLQRIDDAIDAYDSWLIVQREDSEAWQELADARHRAGRWKGAVAALTQAAALDPEDVALQRRLEALRLQLAPAIEVGLLGVGETDIATAGFLLGADVAAGDGSRLAVGLQQRRVSSFDGLAHTRRLGIRADLRPRADLRLQLTGGPVWLRSPDAGTSATRLELGLRMRRSLPGQATLVDVRAQHGLVDVSPELVRLELSRTQVTSTIQQVVGGPWRLRMVGRLGVLGSPQTERTVRTGIGGGPAIALAPGVGISGRWQQTRHHNPGATGYFAPRLAEVVDAGLDIDRDYDSVSIGLDAGAGLQRFERHGEAMGRWTPALRLWSFVAWSLTPGHQVLFEAEGYRSQVAEAVIARDAERWHYASASVSLRVSLR